METINCPLSEHAKRTPHHPALITPTRTWTYQELDIEVHALCDFLKNSEIKAQQRIAFVAQATPGTILLFFALFRLRAIACPLSHRLPQDLLTEYLELLKASHVLEPSLLPPDMLRAKPEHFLIHLQISQLFYSRRAQAASPKSPAIVLQITTTMQKARFPH